MYSTINKVSSEAKLGLILTKRKKSREKKCRYRGLLIFSRHSRVSVLLLLLLFSFIKRHPLYTLNPSRGKLTLLSAIYEQREEVSMDRVLSEPNPSSYDMEVNN